MKWIFLALMAGCSVHNPTFSVEDLAAPSDGGRGAPDGAVDLAHVGDAGCDPATLDVDPRHCGACDHDCTTLPNVTNPTCQAGACVFGCQPGFGDCTADPGCETPLDTFDHCGACGTVCSGNTPACIGGVCSGCAPPTPDLCGHLCVDSAKDPMHCGSCAPCLTPANGSATCSGGVCGIDCNSGFHECGVNECVSDSSVDTCGTNCTPCPSPLAHGMPSCDGTSCGFACDPGFTRSGNTCLSTAACMPACDAGSSCIGGSCCIDDNNGCSSGGSCCSGNCKALLVFGSQCACSRNAGDSCNIDDDCCTGKCVGGTCQQSHAGDFCTANGDCFTNSCSFITLLQVWGTCNCSNLSQDCGNDSDCCKGDCLSGICTCLANTASCTRDDECCSGECVANHCRACNPINSTCNSGGVSCCSGACNGLNQCQCAANGASCVNQHDCCENCDGGKCCTAQGANCTLGNLCCGDKYVCTAASPAPRCCGQSGAACTQPGECCSNVCNGTTCS
jgi:hypothetical protein